MFHVFTDRITNEEVKEPEASLCPYSVLQLALSLLGLKCLQQLAAIPQIDSYKAIP